MPEPITCSPTNAPSFPATIGRLGFGVLVAGYAAEAFTWQKLVWCGLGAMVAVGLGQALVRERA